MNLTGGSATFLGQRFSGFVALLDRAQKLRGQVGQARGCCVPLLLLQQEPHFSSDLSSEDNHGPSPMVHESFGPRDRCKNRNFVSESASVGASCEPLELFKQVNSEILSRLALMRLSRCGCTQCRNWVENHLDGKKQGIDRDSEPVVCRESALISLVLLALDLLSLPRLIAPPKLRRSDDRGDASYCLDPRGPIGTSHA